MQARPLDAFASALVFALCIVWGFNQVVVKLALPDVGPIAQTGVRSGVGALCVIAYALFTRRRIFEIDGTEAAGALAGALFTAEFIALYESLRFTTAARATVFIYAAPFFVALGAAFLLKDERLRPIQWVGLALAFLGVVCGFFGRTNGGALTGDALALLAAALWAATTLVIKATPLRRIDPIKVLLYQIGFAALAAPLTAYAFGEAAPTHLSATSVGSLLWQGVVVAGISYALWFWTLTRYAVAQLSAFTFITPLVGVLAGWLVFGETLSWGFSLAIALVIAGLALVNWPRSRRPALRADEVSRLFEFDMQALQTALDDERRARKLTWDQLAAEINAPFEHTPSIPISVGTLRTMTAKRSVTSGVVLQALRWLRRSPESFLKERDQAPAAAEALPEAGPAQILRFDTRALHAALDAQRRERAMTWKEVAGELRGFTPSMLTNLASGPLIGFPRVMTLTQWLGRPASDFIRARSK